MKPGYIRDRHNGTYYVINKHGRAASVPITVVGCGGRGGSDESRNKRRYVILSDQSIILLYIFEEMLRAGQIVRV